MKKLDPTQATSQAQLKPSAEWGIEDNRQGRQTTTPIKPTKPIAEVRPVTVYGGKGLPKSPDPHDTGTRQGSKKVKPHTVQNPAKHKKEKPHTEPLLHSEQISFNNLGQWSLQKKNPKQEYAIHQNYKKQSKRDAGKISQMPGKTSSDESVYDIIGRIIDRNMGRTPGAPKEIQQDLPLDKPKKN